MQETNNVSGKNVPGALGSQMSEVVRQNQGVGYGSVKARIAHHQPEILREGQRATGDSDLSAALKQLGVHLTAVSSAVSGVSGTLEPLEVRHVEQFYLCCATRFNNYTSLCEADAGAQSAKENFLSKLSSAYEGLAQIAPDSDKKRMLALSQNNAATNGGDEPAQEGLIL